MARCSEKHLAAPLKPSAQQSAAFNKRATASLDTTIIKTVTRVNSTHVTIQTNVQDICMQILGQVGSVAEYEYASACK